MDDSQYDSWAGALSDQGDSMFRLVAVKRRRVRAEAGSSALSPLEHREVQRVLQQPHYSIDSTEGIKPDQKNDSRREEEAILMAAVLQNEEAEDAGSNRIVAHDFTGRWMEITATFERGSSTGVSGLDLYCSVAVRPDGHIAAVFLPRDCSTHEKAMENMSELRKTLLLL